MPNIPRVAEVQWFDIGPSTRVERQAFLFIKPCRDSDYLAVHRSPGALIPLNFVPQRLYRLGQFLQAQLETGLNRS